MNIDLLFCSWELTLSNARARQYDDRAQTVVVTGDLPEGRSWKLYMAVHDEAYLNVVPLTESDGALTAVLTRDDLAFGDVCYTLQLVGERDGETRHTNPVRLYVGASLSGDAVWPEVPRSFTDAEQAARAAADRAETAADRAEAAAERQDWADAKTTGDEIRAIKSALTGIADVYDTSENLFDPAAFEAGRQLTSSGTVYDNSTFALSDYIPVKAGWILNGYIAPNTISGLGGWFDADKVWQGKIEELSGYTLTDRNKRYFTLVCDFDGYIRVNVYANAPYQQAMLKLNTVIDTSLSEPLCQNYHAFEPVYVKVAGLKAQTSYGKYVRENNGLFDGTKAVSGYLARDGAQVWSNARYKTSDYIPVEENTAYVIQGVTSHFCLYDSSKANIASSFDGTGTTNRGFSSGSAAFVRFTYYAAEESRMYVRAASDPFFDTQKGGAYCSDDNPLLGKTLYTIGDSIMAGDGNNGFGIGDILASRNSMYLKDWSRGGATIGWRESQGDSVYNIQYQAALAAAESTPDYILIDGQTNDIDNASTIPVGEIGTSFDSANFVKTTFAGGLETVFSRLKSAFPSAKIVYVRVHHIGSRGIDSQNARCEAAQSVCLKWGVPVADLYGKGTLNTFLPQYGQYTHNADKAHPTREGYDLFYIPLIESVLKAVS